MGSGASTTLQQQPQQQSSIEPNVERKHKDARTLKTARAGAVATVIIKVGQEEWMNFDEENCSLTLGRLGESGVEHTLFKEKLVLVADHSGQNTVVKQCFDDQHIYHSEQLNSQELKDFLMKNKSKALNVVCLRSEPVFFLREKDGSELACHLYDINAKTKYTPEKNCLVNYKSLRLHELDMRKQLVTLATSAGDVSFQYYKSDRSTDNESEAFHCELDDDLLTLEEVMNTVTFDFPETRYQRLIVPSNGIPDADVIDSFISFLNDSINNTSLEVAVLFMCEPGNDHQHVFAALLAALCKMNGERLKCKKSKSQEFLVDHLRIVRSLTALIPDGKCRKVELDAMLDHWGIENLRSAVSNKLQQIMDGSVDNEDCKRKFFSTTVDDVQIYCLLLVCTAFMHDKAENESFSDWLIRNNEILVAMRMSQELIPMENLLMLGRHSFLTNDTVTCTDNLGTKDEMGVFNWRQIPGLPIYGMAQPSPDGLELLAEKLQSNLGHTRIIVVSLRQDPTVICDGTVYNLRWDKNSTELVNMRNVSPAEAHEASFELKKTIVNSKSTCTQFFDASMESIPSVVETPSEAFSHNNLTFIHLPIDNHQAAKEEQFDSIKQLLMNNAVNVNSKDKPAFVFFCHSGKDRTTTAMSIAGLVFCHLHGFPYGAGKGEAERISVRNAMYTKGEFKAIQNIVASLPHGHQTKREVDFILDRVYENGSMMHYHLREEIFVTHKKKQRTHEEKKQCQDLKKLALDYLERYAQLIIFDAYLKDSNGKEISFQSWLLQMEMKRGILTMLDELCFSEFEAACQLKSRLMRNLRNQASYLNEWYE